MGQYSKVETDGRLMIVTINRPEVYNACHPMANQELVEAFDEFSSNPDLWVAIITGAGDKAFCAGNDLKYHAEIQKKTGKRPVHPAKGFGGLANRFVDLGPGPARLEPGSDRLPVGRATGQVEPAQAGARPGLGTRAET